MLRPVNGAMVTLCLLAAHASAKEEPPTLREQLEQKAAESASHLPPAMLKNFAAAIDEVRNSGIEQSAKQVGDQAADGKLSSWAGDEVALSDLWKDQPVVLTWYRGGWCPYCNIHLQALQRALDDIEGAGAKLVALTPELPENARQTAESNELSFLVLHDKQNKLAHKYGIVFKLPDSIAPLYRDRLQLPQVNGYDQLELPLAATYVIDRQGVIRWAFLDADYKKRAEPAEIIEAVKQLEK